MNIMNKVEFSKIRHSLGKTQNEMARILCVSSKTIQSFEQGWRNIPSHVAREMLLLESLKKYPLKNSKACWEVKNCLDEWKENCIVWELRIKNFCWYFNGLWCQGKMHESWEVKMLYCHDCEMHKSGLTCPQ
jgi:DNA-binding XRE family transcriptional regulator